MFKANVSGRNTNWEAQKQWGALSPNVPVATDLLQCTIDKA